MAIVHTFTDSWTNGTAGLSKAVYVSGDVEINIDLAVLSGVTSTIAANVPAASLVGLYVNSDGPCTMRAGVSGQSFSLFPNLPLSWFSGCSLLNPLYSGNVTSGFSFTPGTSGGVNLSFRSMQNI